MFCVWCGVDATAALSALQEILATTSHANIAIASWNRIPSPLISSFADVGGSWDLDISMGTVFEVHGGIWDGESEDVALKAFLIECGSLGAKTVRIPTTMLGTQSPANLRSATSLPISGSPLRQDLGAFGVGSVALWRGGIGAWVGVATGNATGIHDRGLAWCAPWTVLREITASGLAMRIPRTRLRVIVDWLHQTLSFRAMGARIQRFASHSASWATNVASDLVPEAGITLATEIGTVARFVAWLAVCVPGARMSHGTMCCGTSNEARRQRKLHLRQCKKDNETNALPECS